MRRLLVATALGALADDIKRCFTSRGFSVQIVHDGVECVGRALHSPPTALVLDCNLPWGGGTGVLACLREDPATATTPVILLTEQVGHEWDAKGAGTTCLQLTVDVETLYDAVTLAMSDPVVA